jgi:hypothetical protein
MTNERLSRKERRKLERDARKNKTLGSIDEQIQAARDRALRVQQELDYRVIDVELNRRGYVRDDEERALWAEDFPIVNYGLLTLEQRMQIGNERLNHIMRRSLQSKNNQIRERARYFEYHYQAGNIVCSFVDGPMVEGDAAAMLIQPGVEEGRFVWHLVMSLPQFLKIESPVLEAFELTHETQHIIDLSMETDVLTTADEKYAKATALLEDRDYKLFLDTRGYGVQVLAYLEEAQLYGNHSMGLQEEVYAAAFIPLLVCFFTKLYKLFYQVVGNWFL